MVLEGNDFIAAEVTDNILNLALALSSAVPVQPAHPMLPIGSVSTLPTNEPPGTSFSVSPRDVTVRCVGTVTTERKSISRKKSSAKISYQVHIKIELKHHKMEKKQREKKMAEKRKAAGEENQKTRIERKH